MKTFKQSYPRRREMLKTPFVPMSDGEFRESVRAKEAIPCEQGTTLFVSKWRDGPGIDPDAFLAAVHAQGSQLMVRRFETDVNIRVVRPAGALTGRRGGAARSKPLLT